MPKVSIILPVYNVEKYIAKSIKSVIDQTYLDFELLIVIDGSLDNSKKIADHFALGDSRIQVLEKSNGGLSDARNFGLERAKGEFIYFMDSDDWIEAKLLEDNIKLIEDEKLDLVIFGYFQDVEDSNNNIISSIDVIPLKKTFRKKETNIGLDQKTLGLMGYAWNKIYRKSFLDMHFLNFEKGTSLVEDILFNIQVYISTNVLRFNDSAYYHYVNRPGTTLMKTFHANSFELKKRKTNALELLFQTWNFNDTHTILALSAIQGVRYCIHNLFSFRNQLNFQQKVSFIKHMLNDEQTDRLVKAYQPNSLSDKVYKKLIQYKCAFTIAVLAKTYK